MSQQPSRRDFIPKATKSSETRSRRCCSLEHKKGKLFSTRLGYIAHQLLNRTVSDGSSSHWSIFAIQGCHAQMCAMLSVSSHHHEICSNSMNVSTQISKRTYQKATSNSEPKQRSGYCHLQGLAYSRNG